MKYHQEMEFCEHCEKETLHEIIDGEHERDSSQDRWTCLECKWWRDAYESEYKPPYHYPEDDSL